MAASLQALACTMLLLLAAVPHACMAASTTLQDTCEKYASGDRSGSSYDYCVRTLQRDSKSAIADDALGLALIAARIARATAKRTRDKIAALLADETVLSRRGGLAACFREYAATVRRLGHARSAARVAGNKNVEHARTLLADARGAPARCGAAFAAAGQRDSPLDDGDLVIDDEIELAISIRPSQP